MKHSSRFVDSGLKVLILIIALLGGKKLCAATTDPYAIGSVTEHAQLNKVYDANNKWYLFQWYTDAASVSLEGYDAESARNLVLEFNYYVEDFDSDDDVPELFAGNGSKFDDFIELGFGKDNTPGFTWHFDRSSIRKGWNKLKFPFSAISDAEWASRFQADGNFVWFRLAIAHAKTEHAYLMRLSDVRVTDPGKTIPVLRTEYDEPIMNPKDLTKPWSGSVNVRKDLAFWSAVDYNPADGLDFSNLDLSKLYMEFDLEITENQEGAFEELQLANPRIFQVQIASVRGNDEQAIGYKTCEAKEPMLGKHHYAFNLAALANKEHDYAHMRFFGLNISVPVGLTTDKTCRVVLSNPRIMLDENVEKAERLTVPSIFSDNMMFQQKKPLHVWGYSTGNSEVTVTLKKGENVIASEKAGITDGRWSVNLPAQDASFDPLEVVITNGKQTFNISNVLIGEVWVAGGQSNMELAIKALQTQYMEELKAEPANQNIRIFFEPSRPTGNVSPFVPEKDINGAYWMKPGDFDQIQNCSAVAYYMAKEIQPKINAPVGILYTPIGGSRIEAWIPREEIESEEFAALRDALRRDGSYYDESFWINDAHTLTGYYNAKIGPLAGFNTAGTIWYQGESNSERSQFYTDELMALKKGWSRTFGFDEETDPMPFVFCQLAPWVTGTDLMLISQAMTDAYTKMSDRRVAMFPIYDTDLSHIGNSTIHPTNKKPVGMRFATAVYNLCYNPAGAVYSAPVVKSVELGDKVAKVTFDNAGEGLRTLNGGSDVIGFTVAGANGMHVNAEAHVTDKNIVEVSLAGVDNPTFVSYAWQNFNISSNLCNSEGLPAAPFRNDATASQTYMKNMDWLEMDVPSLKGYVWGKDLPTYSPGWIGGDNPTWTSDDATLTFDADNCFYGLASLNVNYATAPATVSAGVDSHTPPTGAPANQTHNRSLAVNLNGYTGMRVMVKNPDSRAKELTLSITPENKSTYTLTKSIGASDTGFKPVYFDFSKLQHSGATVASIPNFGRIRALDFIVTDTEAGQILLDHATMLTTAEIVEDSLSGVDCIVSDDVLPAEIWHTIQGIRIDGVPTAPGLFISNRGSKMVIR